MIEVIKKYKKLLIVITILLIIGVPFAIHCLFKVTTNSEWWHAEWSAGEILNYCGAVLAFIGTVLLGLLAIYQNDIINKQALKNEELLREMAIQANRPMFFIEKEFSQGNHSNLQLKIKNVSDNFASRIELKDIKISRNVEPEKTEDVEIKKAIKETLAGREECKVELNNSQLNVGDRILGNLVYEDKYGERHINRVEGLCKDLAFGLIFRIYEIKDDKEV